MRERVAIIGSGVSGLTAAYQLHHTHDIEVYEADSYIGGHTATVDTEYQGVPYSIDTGFIVFNLKTYPNFIALLDELGIQKKQTWMGFGVSDCTNALEFNTSGSNGYFAQRKNLFSLKHWRLLKDILHFNQYAKALAEFGEIDETITLREYVKTHRYSDRFINYYLVPLTAVIWSQDTESALDIPLHFFVKFFYNHGLFNKEDILDWYVVKGNSRAYIPPLIKPFADRVHVNCPIQKVERHDDHVQLTFADGGSDRYDRVIIATHSDQALSLLSDPTSAERSVLQSIKYSTHDVSLHYDDRVLPQEHRAWEAWNIEIGTAGTKPVFTYNMNALQGIEAPVTFCISLDADDLIDQNKMLYKTKSHHPIFNSEILTAQKRWSEISQNRTVFASAYWRNGFHEDGVWSGIRAAKALGAEPGIFSRSYTE